MNHYNSKEDFFGTDSKNLNKSFNMSDNSNNSMFGGYNSQGRNDDPMFGGFDEPIVDMRPASSVGSSSNVGDKTYAGVCIARAYLFMFIGVLISGITAVIAANTLDFTDPNTVTMLFGVLIAETIVFFIASYNVAHGNTKTTGFMFLLYSILTGISISVLFLAYQMESIISIFFVAAGMFGVLAFAGSVTKHDLSIIGQIGIMLIVGVLLMMVANIFIGSEKFDLQISMIGLAAFIGITAYDAQKLKRRAQTCTSYLTVNTIAMVCALELYLDFINIFLRLLRLFGKRK